MNILAFTQIDAVFFLVAGVLGVYGIAHAEGPWYGRSLSWGVIALWALLKLLKVL